MRERTRGNNLSMMTLLGPSHKAMCVMDRSMSLYTAPSNTGTRTSVLYNKPNARASVYECVRVCVCVRVCLYLPTHAMSDARAITLSSYCSFFLKQHTTLRQPALFGQQSTLATIELPLFMCVCVCVRVCVRIYIYIYIYIVYRCPHNNITCNKFSQTILLQISCGHFSFISLSFLHFCSKVAGQ